MPNYRGRILVVDDDESIRNTLRDYILEKSFYVETVKSGTLMLKRLAEEKFQIVFLDFIMPNMGGVECLKRIRRQFPHIFIVILSRSIDEKAYAQCVKLGAHSFVEKPIDKDYLNVVLDRFASMLN